MITGWEDFTKEKKKDILIGSIKILEARRPNKSISLQHLEGGKCLIKPNDFKLPLKCSIEGCGESIGLPFYYCHEFNKVFCSKECALNGLTITSGGEGQGEMKTKSGSRRICGCSDQTHEHFFIVDVQNK